MKLASKSDCTACGACVDICNKNALSISVDSNGFFQVDVHKDRCVECGLCSRVCPVINELVVTKRSLPYAAWCKDYRLRSKAASGGAFAAIAKSFLEQGAIVYGAAIDGFDVKHIRISNLSELPALLGSKYQHSAMTGIYRMVKSDLNAGRIVLFSGLSCQVSGIIKYVGEQLSERLFTVDTICGGVSTLLPMVQLAQSEKYSRIISFRDKSDGWKSTGFQYRLLMCGKNDEVCDLGTNNLVIKSFCCPELKRISCLKCRFVGEYRNSDLTIGDFWGDRNFTEEHNDGLSVLILHTQRLEMYLSYSELELVPINWKDFIEYNSPFYWSDNRYSRLTLKRWRTLRAIRTRNNKLALMHIMHDSIIDKIIRKIARLLTESARREALNKF